jgi:2-polyprenyl-3-methyl-5-hydroxy-6-metoxy-1,4-benzoquinol methylase
MRGNVKKGVKLKTQSSLLDALEQTRRLYGEWSYNIPLPFDVWTRPGERIPHTRLKRIAQIAIDMISKPITECRVLDLGCLEGMFAIEFAQMGARTLGIDVREANVQKAIFCKNVLSLQNLEFVKDDVRRISRDKYFGLTYVEHSVNSTKLQREMALRLASVIL